MYCCSMNTEKCVSVGMRITQKTVISAKKYVAERPGLTLSRLYELAVDEFIRGHKEIPSTDRKEEAKV